MGMGGISVWQLLIVLLIVLLLFGGKKLRGLGADLGGAIKGFRSSVRDGEQETTAEKRAADQPQANQQAVEDVDARIKALLDEKARLQESQGSGRVINSEAAGKSEHKA